MKVFNFTWIVLYFKVIIAREEWIDPHDMNIRLKSTLREISGNRDNACDEFYKEKSSSYVKKTVGFFIKVVKYDNVFEGYTGQLNIELSREDYDFLKRFISSDEIDDSSLRQVDTILHNSIQNGTFDTIVLKMSEYIHIAFFNEQSAIFFGLLFLLFLLWKIQPHNYTMKSLFKLFLPLVYISDFVLRYHALIEEVEIDKYLEFKKKNCDAKNLGWLEWFYDKFTGSCQSNDKKFLLSQRAAYHIITPMKVLSEQFDIVVPILKYTGQGFGKFMWTLIEDVPWYVKPFVAVLAFILVIIIILMVGSHMLGISPKFNILHILKIEFSHKEDNISIERQQQDSISGDNLRILLKSKKHDSSANRNNDTHRLKYWNPVTKKTKEQKRKKISKLENAVNNLKSIEYNKSTENRIEPPQSSSSSITVD